MWYIPGRTIPEDRLSPRFIREEKTMSRRRVRFLSGVTILIALAAVAYYWGRADERAGRGILGSGAAHAAESKPLISPVAARDRDVYFPLSEDLAPDEMRIFSACFFVELGNGDKFLFDGGTGSHVRIGSLGIPYDFIDKMFISHLHTDHFGDFAAYSIGAWVGGRSVPLHVWGPSGSRSEMGTKYAIDHWMKALTWDIEGRAGRLPASGGEVIVHEFDYKGENEVVYQKNGVTIRSWPAIHSLDGPVSYSLEWKGLRFVYGGDTYPNQWFVRYAAGADVAIHECMMAVEDAITKYKFPPPLALEVLTQIHTTPESFGKIMSMVKPRMAIAFHFFNDFDTSQRVLRGILSTYDGPLTLAKDYLVWNVTKDDIRVREVFVNENMWPPPPAYPKPPMDPALMKFVSKEIGAGYLDEAIVIDQAIYDRINKKYGTDLKQRRQDRRKK
jgi:ribonuclease Z